MLTPSAVENAMTTGVSMRLHQRSIARDLRYRSTGSGHTVAHVFSGVSYTIDVFVIIPALWQSRASEPELRNLWGKGSSSPIPESRLTDQITSAHYFAARSARQTRMVLSSGWYKAPLQPSGPCYSCLCLSYHLRYTVSGLAAISTIISNSAWATHRTGTLDDVMDMELGE